MNHICRRLQGDLIELKQKRSEKTTSHRRLNSNRIFAEEWIKANNLGKGDFVNLEELASGDLRLSSFNLKHQKK